MKKYKNLIKVILILAILGLIVVGIINYTDFLNGKENGNGKEELLDVNGKEVKDMYNIIDVEEDGGVADYFQRKDVANANDIDNVMKLKIAYKKLFGDNYDVKSFTKADVEGAMKSVFGSDIKYTDETFAAGKLFAYFDYDSKAQKYIAIDSGGAGGINEFSIAKDIYKAVKKGDTFELYQKFGYVYYSYEDTSGNIFRNNGLYSDSLHNKLIENDDKIAQSLFEDSFTKFNVDLSKYYDKLEETKYTFKVVEGKYIFVASKIIK